MNRKLQFALMVLAFGAWNMASAQSTAPAKSVAKPVVAQAGTSAPGMTVAQAPAGLGGQALGAEAVELGAGAMTVTSGAALGTVTVLGGVAQSQTAATTTATHH